MKIEGLFLVLCCLFSGVVLCQEKTVVIKGSVKEEYTLKPIKDAEIRVRGKAAVKTDVLGDFKIEAIIGEELVISHQSFLTTYYTIKDNQRIDVVVKEVNSISKFKSLASKDNRYSSNLEQAKKHLKKDAAISIDYIQKTLETIRDDDKSAKVKKAEVYLVLADIYSYWKQFDFAEENYKNSLFNKFDKDVKIKLGNAQLLNNSFDIALVTFTELLKKRLSSKQRVAVYEGIGDSYKGLEDENQAIANYNKALGLAQKKKYDAKVITLNSKLADVLQIQGNIKEATNYVDNSVQLANRRSKRVSAKQRAKAADFYNKNSSYKKEIELRKEALVDIEKIETEESADDFEIVEDDVIMLEEVERSDRAITSQVQNYKIANAFVAQEEYNKALPYLEESIKKAASENDLVVQKDATRKLGEVYREQGDLKKASETFAAYGTIVDKLYLQKEQEISQAARFNRELAKKENRITSLEKDRVLNENKYKLAFASQELAIQESIKQQIVIYSLIGLTLLLLFVGYLMYRNIKQQKQANNMLALKSLRSQMNPHFIFNALNSVNTFIATNDERAANKYLTEFSLLMRAVLENSEEDFISLDKEIELLELYVKLEHFRFQDKFDYKMFVDPKIDVSSYMIPPMLVQPYIENAVWHGLRYKSEKGILSLSFNYKDENSIEIIIEDDGIGREKSKALKTEHQKKQKSKGMSNIEERISILNTMYSDRVDVTVTDVNQSSGTRVALRLKKEY